MDLKEQIITDLEEHVHYQEIKKATEIIGSSIKLVIDKLDEQLSTNHIMYDVEFGGRIFSFKSPTTPQEEDEQKANRKEFICLLLDYSLATLLDVLSTKEPINPWEVVEQLAAMHRSRENVASPIAAQEYETIKLEAKDKAKPVNFETYEGVMEDPTLTEVARDAKLVDRVTEKGA